MLLKKNNPLGLDVLDLGASVNNTIKSVNCCPEKKCQFKIECLKILIILLKEVQEKCTWNYQLLCPASVFSSMADKLADVNLIFTKNAHDAKYQFEDFTRCVCCLN